MQLAKTATASAKETAANIGASAQAGMEKTKAALQEKVEKMTAQHPAEKEMAEQKKEEKIREAEINKREAMNQNAAAKEQVRAGHTSGQADLTRTAAPPVPGRGHVTEGVVESHPIGISTGTGRPAASLNPRVEGTAGGPYT